MTTDQRGIRKLRPRLSTISPLVHWISVGFIWLNVWLAHILWTTKQPKLKIYNSVMTPKFWGIVFLVLSAGIAYGLLTNRWQVIRRSMIAGLFVKAVFMYALVALALQISLDAVEGSLALWLFLVWVQIGAVMFFLPPVPTRHGDDR